MEAINEEWKQESEKNLIKDAKEQERLRQVAKAAKLEERAKWEQPKKVGFFERWHQIRVRDSQRRLELKRLRCQYINEDLKVRHNQQLLRKELAITNKIRGDNFLARQKGVQEIRRIMVGY